MANEYYDSTGAPANASLGNPALIRAEFDAIEGAFDKLPTLTGNANEAIFVNAGATGLEALSAADARARLGAEASANKDASGGFVGLTLLKINFKNVLGTFTSFLTNSNSAARTYTFPDSDGTVALTSDMPLNGRKNWLINGDFMVWQRDITQTVAGYGSADRWYTDAVGSTFQVDQLEHTVGQTDVPDNPRYYLENAVTSVANAANYVNMSQRIEGVHNLSGQDITLSFYARAAALDIAIEAVQNFGTGGAPSADVTAIDVTTVTLTADWAYYEVTLTIPSIAGKTLGTNNDDYLEIIFWLDAGANFNARTNTLGQQSATFDFSHIQVEVGTSGTSFERRTIGEERELCYRYYVGDTPEGDFPVMIFSSDVTTGNTYVAKMDLMVAMRTTPAVTLTHVLASRFPAAAGAATATSYSIYEERVCNSTGVAGYFQTSVIADAEL